MVRITVDEKLKQQILANDSMVELCDSTGKLIARVTPLPQDLSDPWSLFPELTPEEIERRCNSPGPRYSTEQVKEFLRNPESRPW